MQKNAEHHTMKRSGYYVASISNQSNPFGYQVALLIICLLR